MIKFEYSQEVNKIKQMLEQGLMLFQMPPITSKLSFKHEVKVIVKFLVCYVQSDD